MKTFRTVLTLLLVGAITALGTASAQAMGSQGPTNPILRKCELNGDQLTGHYSVAALKAAYNSIGASVTAYTTCAQVIENKINQEVDGQGINTGGGSGGGGFPWIIVVIVVIALAGGGGALWSYRRSRAEGGAGEPGAGQPTPEDSPSDDTESGGSEPTQG
jgi:hypothetical protein